MASHPDPRPAGGTRAPSSKSIPASRTKFLIFHALATTCSHRLLIFLYFLFHPDQIRFILTSMDQQSPSIARLKEVWRPLRIFEQRRQRLADELGLSVEIVERMVREECEPKPVGGRPKNWAERLSQDGEAPGDGKIGGIARVADWIGVLDPKVSSTNAALRIIVSQYGQLTGKDLEIEVQSLRHAVKHWKRKSVPPA